MNIGSHISSLKGIGEKTETLFSKAGINTVRDLILYFPRKYEIYDKPVSISDAEEGKIMTIAGSVSGRISVSGRQSLQITSLYLRDTTGTIKVIWFRMPFLRGTLGKGGLLILRGRIIRRHSELVMEHPEIFYPSSKYQEKADSMQPVYSLTAGLTNNIIIKAVRQALEHDFSSLDILPDRYVKKYDFPSYTEAVRQMHFPESRNHFIEARKRFVYEEFLIFILCLRKLKENRVQAKNNYKFHDCPEIDQFINQLPYDLTGAQKNVWLQIKSDMLGASAMSRLVQGDVGSGKTIIAFLALLLVGLNGYQGALMAPTEVLAKQHFENISKILRQYNIPVSAVLLTGSLTAGQKRETYEKIVSGECSIIIGTQALIQEKTIYHNLALVVTDEQHRFGVKQRETLAGKGNSPHILVMSATPIPRTLAIILYGDLDISVIDEMPRNRIPIKNCVVNTEYRDTAYKFMKKQTESGKQCYIICPMIEESDTLDAENVLDYSRMLSEKMGENIRIACLHGKMKQHEKDELMEEFAQNKIHILVSTTVIEVGIDVPNATVIMIENAERFGLAQLHQLRGRVGRGSSQSYCIFMTPSKSKETKERLEILNHSNDGFYIAREDLRLRGPGDLFGIKQSGILDFQLADIFQDAAILQQASEDASQIITEDSCLNFPENQKIKQAIDQEINDIMLETTL